MPTDMEILNDESGPEPEVAAAAESAASAEAPEAAAAIADATGTPDEFGPQWDAPEGAPAKADGADVPGAAPATAEKVVEGFDGIPAASPLGKVLAEDAGTRELFRRVESELSDYRQIQEVIPTPEAAHEAVQARDALAEFDRLYFGNSPEQFLQRLYEAQAPNGRSSGVYERVMQTGHRALLDSLDQHAAASGDERLQEAVAAIREYLPWAQAQSQHQQVPAALQGQLYAGQQAQRELAQMRAAEAQARDARRDEFLGQIAAEAESGARAYVGRVLARTAFSQFERDAIADRFMDKLEEMAQADRGYAAALADLAARSGTGADARALLLQRMTGWVDANRRQALEPVVAAASAARKQKVAAAAATRAGWRNEPHGAGAPAGTSRISGAELETALRKTLGRRPTDMDILDAE